MTLRLVPGGQRDRLRHSQLEELDRALDRIRFDEAMDRTAQKVARWKRRKAMKAPLLWAAAAVTAALAWLGRSK
jgi:hypothetical protein